MITEDAVTSTTGSDWKVKSHTDPMWGTTNKNEDDRVHLTKWMPLQNTTDLMYIWIGAQKCLFSMYLTVLCLSYTLETPPFFPLKSFYCLDRPLDDKKQQKRQKQQKNKKNKYRKSETERTQRMLGPFNEDKRSPPHYLFKVMHLLGNVMFFMFIKTNVLPPPILVLFSLQKGYMGSI